MAVRLEWNLAPDRVLRPASLLLALVNLVPLVGVIFWGWDVFLVLLLFWCETATIAFWSIVGIALMRPGTSAPLGGETVEVGSPLGMALFVTVHSGIFLIVHLVLLWSLTGPSPSDFPGPGAFLDRMLIGSGLWIAVAGLFLAYGISFLRQAGLDPVRRIAKLLLGRDTVAEDRETGSGPALGLLYGRIIGMQFAIILGGLFAIALGSMGPLLVLILAKTTIDLGLIVSADAK